MSEVAKHCTNILMPALIDNIDNSVKCKTNTYYNMDVWSTDLLYMQRIKLTVRESLCNRELPGWLEGWIHTHIGTWAAESCTVWEGYPKKGSQSAAGWDKPWGQVCSLKELSSFYWRRKPWQVIQVWKITARTSVQKTSLHHFISSFVKAWYLLYTHLPFSPNLMTLQVALKSH